MSASLHVVTQAIRHLIAYPHLNAEQLAESFPTLDGQQVTELIELYAVPVVPIIMIDPSRPETIRQALSTLNTLYMV